MIINWLTIGPMHLFPMHDNIRGIPLLLLLLLLIELRQCSALRLNNLALRKKVEPLHPAALPQYLTYSSSSSSYTNRGTISLGVPRGYDEVNPMAFNIMGSPSTDVMSNKGAGSVATAGATPYKSSSPPSYNSMSSKRWEYSNSATPLQRQSLGRSGNAVDSLSNRLEDIEHRKSKLITKVMHH